jgi:adenosylmethionine-8-amino-7-oxononanoate aminotransferase
VRVKGAIGVVQMDRQTEALRHAFPPLGVWARPFGDIVYLTPPLTVGEADLSQLTAAVRQVVAEAGPKVTS